LKVRVFYTPNCPKCPKVKEVVKKIASEFGLVYEEVDVSTPNGFTELLMVQSTAVPIVCLNDEVLARGEIDEFGLRKEVRKRL